MSRRRKKTSKIRTIISVMLIAAMVFTFAIAYAGEGITRYTGKAYSQNVQYSEYVIANGLDVSTYQRNLDWNKIKAAGIDFAIIRIGGRGYGSAGKLYSDDKFIEHMEGAKKANIMTGIYFFSQCINTEEAIEEADYTIELLTASGYSIEDLDLPIFMDYEMNSSSYRIHNMTKAKRTKCAEAFLGRLSELGYKGGIYTNVQFAENSMENAEALADKYMYWVANYNSYCSLSFNTYQMWQYSSSGVVNGSSARSDVNFLYLNLKPKATQSEDQVITTYDEYGMEHTEIIPAKRSLVDASVYVNATGYTYNEGKAYEPSVSVSYGGETLTQGIDYKVKYIHNTQAGTAYAYVIGTGDYLDYQLKPFTIEKSSATSTLSIAAIADRTYTGAVTKPSDVTIKDTNGNTLIKGLDYSFVGANAKNVGTASLKITFKENYSGTRTVNYNIVKAEQKLTIGNAPSEVASDQEDFNIKAASDFEEAKLKYTSSDDNIATIAEDGTVHITGHGTVTITAAAPESSNLKAAAQSFTMIVKAPPQNVTTTYTKYKKNLNSGSFNLNAKTNGDGEITYEVEVVEAVNKINQENDGISAAESDQNGESAAADSIVSPGEIDIEKTPEASETQADSDTPTDNTITENNNVIRVTSGGRVIIEGPGTAVIHVRASETRYFEAGEKLVTVVVSDVDDDIKLNLDEAMKAAVEATTITSFKASSKTGKTSLSWTKSKSKYGVDFYQIWRSEKKSSGYKKIFETSTGKTYSYTDNEKLVSGKTYYYKIRGVRYVNGKAVYTPYLKISAKAR